VPLLLGDLSLSSGDLFRHSRLIWLHPHRWDHVIYTISRLGKLILGAFSLQKSFLCSKTIAEHISLWMDIVGVRQLWFLRPAVLRPSCKLSLAFEHFKLGWHPSLSILYSLACFILSETRYSQCHNHRSFRVVLGSHQSSSIRNSPRRPLLFPRHSS
jgi:hypothetical protein